MTTYPTSAAARAAERDARFHAYMANAERRALWNSYSIKCGDWEQHAPDGCQNSGSTCLCACHDPKES